MNNNNTIIKMILLFIVIVSFIQFTNLTNKVIEGNYSSENALIQEQEKKVDIELSRLRYSNEFCCIDTNRPVVASQLKLNKETCKLPNSDRSCGEKGTYTQGEINELESGEPLLACKIPPPLDTQGNFTSDSYKNVVPVSTLQPKSVVRVPSKSNIAIGDEVTYTTLKSNTLKTGIVVKIDSNNKTYTVKAIDIDSIDIIKKKYIQTVNVGMFKYGEYLYDPNFKPFDFAYYDQNNQVCSYPAPRKISSMSKPTGDMYQDYYSPPNWFIHSNICSVNGIRCSSTSLPSITYPNPIKSTSDDSNGKYKLKTYYKPSPSSDHDDKYSYIVSGPIII